MTAEWKVEGRRLLIERPPWFEVYQESVRLPSGRLVEDFYTIAIPDYVVVAGFDGEGNVLAERHYRHGAQTVTWALPSGYIDPGEDAEHAPAGSSAKRPGTKRASGHGSGGLWSMAIEAAGGRTCLSLMG